MKANQLIKEAKIKKANEKDRERTNKRKYNKIL